MQSKTDAFITLAGLLREVLRCPLCRDSLNVCGKSMVCAGLSGKAHTFDIARRGYVNLFCGSTKIAETYDRELFAARSVVSDAGLYDPLAASIGEILSEMNRGVILDAGCGCGNLTKKVRDSISDDSKFIALDLSKEGIEYGASNYFGADLLYLVGNLNNLPVSDKTVDVVLNIMSPASYSEFTRVLRDGGVVIKVIQEAQYLCELRRFIYGDGDHGEYSNGDVLANLAESMEIVSVKDVTYTHRIEQNALGSLFDMTPLTREIDDREVVKRRFCDEFNGNVTLDFKIVTAGKVE
ncbi:hypothetical protein FACS1894105_13750 [Clostridia bacterium]|nr:hypothetical protein FACS1894105_13750 [Clostridia bacterium]